VFKCISADFMMCSIFNVICAIILYSILCTFWQHQGEEGSWREEWRVSIRSPRCVVVGSGSIGG
jgi:hypothetical protein